MEKNLDKKQDRNTVEQLEAVNLGDFFSISSFAEHFDVPEQTVRRWLREGKVPAIKLGRLWRIHKDTVARIESGEFVITADDGEAEPDSEE